MRHSLPDAINWKNHTLGIMRIFHYCSVALRILFLLISIIVPSRGWAGTQLPDPELSWKNVNVDGKKSTVFCIFKDSRGLVWIGSNNGLYFYDGVTAHSVGNHERAGLQIYSIIEHENKLYVGSNNGLLIYDYVSGLLNDSQIPTPKEIRVLLLVDNHLWIGGLNGILRYNLSTNILNDYSEGLPHRSVYSIVRDSRGILYAGTYNGLARWDSESECFNKINIEPSLTGQHTSLFVNCLLESDDKKSIYVGGEGFLLRYFPTIEQWEKVIIPDGGNIKSMTRGELDHIFVGTDNGVFDISKEGMKHYRHDTRQELSLAGNEIWTIFVDSQNNIWAGHDRGFSIASNSRAIRTLKLSSLTLSGEGNEIFHIFRDHNYELWLGGTNGVLHMPHNNQQATWHRHSESGNSLSHNRIRAIHEDSDHNMWFATDAGVNRLDKGTNNFDKFYIVDENGTHNSNWVYAIVEDNGYFWIGSFLNGIHYVDKNKFDINGGIIAADKSINSDTKPFKLNNDLINNIIKDPQGCLWILLFRDNVLTRYNPATEDATAYDIFNMTGEYPTHICLDNGGNVWCAHKGGAIIFNTTNSKYKSTKFPQTNSDESIMAIGAVGDGLWVSTLSNVWSLNASTLEAQLLPIPQKSYTAVYEDKFSNKVYLGGTDEIVEVDRDIINKATDYKTIKMVLNDTGEGHFNLSDLQGSDNVITIPSGGGVTLVVSSLDYSPEAVQRYMYKLSKTKEDMPGGWIVMPEGSNTITFSDLNMGNYNLLVKTIGSPTAPIAIPLIVKAPFALSTWAIIAYIAIAIALIIWIIWYVRKRSIRALREQERQNELESVERKLSFLSNISHDLKTPLSMIIGPVSQLKERAKDEDSKKSLETVYNNAVRLNNMIHRTIELQHLEDADESLLILSTFDIVEFCKGVFDVFKENNPQKNFVFHSSVNQIHIEGDAVKFESIITNLLSNACKYSSADATISCGISKQGDNVEIVVSDDGVGISDSDQSLVFQRMYRSASASALKEGTGLGLYLIKKYLELMRGNISLYSKEGQGTSFVVSLPISENVALQSSHRYQPANVGKSKILIVDDNVQISDFIADFLKNDFTTLTAANGRSGFAIASSFLPDLIIVDEMMPIMNGLEMVKLLKQHPRLSHIPVIMLTAKSDIITENESIKLGIDVFMAKPFEPKALIGRIKLLLKSRNDIKERIRIQAITESESKPITAETANEKLLAKIAKTIEENISDPDLNVNSLCEKLGLDQKHLYRLIKKYMNTAPLDYIRRVRLQKAAVLLSQRRFTVSEIAYMVGFKTPSYFAKCFQAQFGVKPSQYQSDDEI